MRSPEQILKRAKTILLIDWPAINVPLTLIKAGFTVYSYSPDSYTEATVRTESGKEHLVFNGLTNGPAAVDIVNIFRPEEEHADIFKKHVLPLQAKVVWLQPPVKSATARNMAATHHLEFIEGVAIADIAAKI